jgi:threonine dehydrogenase-like Zn-dependent dehydrogenase
MAAITCVNGSGFLVSGRTTAQFSGTKSIPPSGCTSTSLDYTFGGAGDAANRLARIPPDLSYSEGALLEPLSVILHGIAGAKVKLGRPALVCGAGPIGLVTLAGARASGAHPLVITDIDPERLKFAKKLVPSTQTYLIRSGVSPEKTAKEIRELYGNDEYEAPVSVLECTGVESSVCTAIHAVRRGGTVSKSVLPIPSRRHHQIDFHRSSSTTPKIHVQDMCRSRLRPGFGQYFRELARSF